MHQLCWCTFLLPKPNRRLKIVHFGDSPQSVLVFLTILKKCATILLVILSFNSVLAATLSGLNGVQAILGMGSSAVGTEINLSLSDLNSNRCIEALNKANTTVLAKELGVTLFVCGHHATEICGIKALGEVVAKQFNLEHEFCNIFSPV